MSCRSVGSGAAASLDDSGLMAAWWTSSQLRLVQSGDLHFSEEEASQLREAVQRRGMAAAGETVAMIPR